MGSFLHENYIALSDLVKFDCYPKKETKVDPDTYKRIFNGKRVHAFFYDNSPEMLKKVSNTFGYFTVCVIYNNHAVTENAVKYLGLSGMYSKFNKKIQLIDGNGIIYWKKHDGNYILANSRKMKFASTENFFKIYDVESAHPLVYSEKNYFSVFINLMKNRENGGNPFG
jgi:hypothetical protein